MCNLVNLGYSRRGWTYEKNVTGGSYCHVLLDRALTSTTWLIIFLHVALYQETIAGSYHSPIWLKMMVREARSNVRSFVPVWVTLGEAWGFQWRTWTTLEWLSRGPLHGWHEQEVVHFFRFFGTLVWTEYWICKEIKKLKKELELLQNTPHG